MENKTSDSSLAVPIIVGMLSVVGILMVLIALRVGMGRSVIQTEPTETSLKFQYLATEPGVVTLAPLGSATPAISPTAFLFAPDEPGSPTSDLFLFPTTPAPALRATNTSAILTPIPLGITYDDANFALNYTGNWIGQSGVNGVYQNTLHLSNTIGDAVQLSFVGQKIRVLYQAGPSLGMVAIKLDSVDFILDQSAVETKSGEWESPLLVLSSHTIIITHISGGSINIDALVVVDVSTATPTITPTVP